MARVLVVDDEHDILELLRVNLELDGHQVTSAPDGPSALDLLGSSAPPDVIVLDVMMPGMDGWEVLSRLKATAGPVAEVPVLMLTARSEDLDRIRGGIEGAIRYITKPFSISELRKEVGAAAAGDPEPVQRRRVQHESLEQLARLEKGEALAATTTATAPRPHLTRLEHIDASAPTDRGPRHLSLTAEQLVALSPKQRELLRAVATTPTVRAAAECLSVSRSNVYAGLRRIARKLDVGSVPELAYLVRQGGVADLGL